MEQGIEVGTGNNTPGLIAELTVSHPKRVITLDLIERVYQKEKMRKRSEN